MQIRFGVLYIYVYISIVATRNTFIYKIFHLELVWNIIRKYSNAISLVGTYSYNNKLNCS